MDQQQFKVRMSVSTKLLLIISFLLITPIFFLNLSGFSIEGSIQAPAASTQLFEDVVV